MSHRRWLSDTESLLAIKVEENNFLARHEIDQHRVFDATARAPASYRDEMAEGGYFVAIGAVQCVAGHAMRNAAGECDICQPETLKADAKVRFQREAAATLRRMAEALRKLDDDELAFLRKHDLTLDDVFCAIGMPVESYGSAMKASGKPIASHTLRCPKGHRLRNRHGKCVMCQPISLVFALRYRRPAVVYLAHSPTGKYFKVGMSNDLDDRLQQLNIHRYGERADWRIVEHRACALGGRAEHQVHVLLAEYAVDGVYDGRPEYCRELFKCSKKVAVQAFREGT